MANQTMLQTQREFVEYLERANVLVKEAGLDSDKALNKSKDGLIKAISEQELLVPVVGGFSAGKSTALNAFLGEAVLSVDISPETALATELRYTEGESYGEGVKENGQSERLSLAEFSELKNRASDFAYARLYLNNARLKAIAPLVLVDMPGFEAPYEAHNKAIMRYLAFGTHFIITHSLSSGALTASIKSHIANLQSLNRGFSFVLTKCDLKPQSELDEIKIAINDELSSSFGYDEGIVCLGKDKFDSFDKIISSIEPELLFERLFKDSLKSDFKDTKSALQTKIAALKADKEEAQNAIKELEKGVSKISSLKDNLNADTDERALNAANASIDAVIFALKEQMSSLANAALSGESALGAEISQMVRSVLLSEWTARTKTQQERLITAFKAELSDLNLSAFEINSAWVEDISASINNALNGASLGIQDSFFDKFDNSPIGALFIALSRLIKKLPVPAQVKAILTPIVALLPSLLKALFGGKSVDENALASSILPKIKDALQTEVQKAYKDSFNTIKEAIAIFLEGKLKEKQAQITSSQEEKAQILAQLETKISSLSDISTRLDSLASEYLYK